MKGKYIGLVIFLVIVSILAIFYSSVKKVILTEEDAKNFVLKWASAVFDNKLNINNTAENIDSFFLDSGILRGTISRLIRTKYGSYYNNLKANSENGLITGLNNPEKYTIKNYFKYFNGVNLKGLNGDYKPENNKLLRITNNVGITVSNLLKINRIKLIF